MVVPSKRLFVVKYQNTIINSRETAIRRLLFLGVSLLHIFSRQEHKPGKFFFMPFPDYQWQTAKSRT